MDDRHMYVDEEDEPNAELNLITNEIIGAAIAVHRELGPGLLEQMYENALAMEFSLRGVQFQRQVPVAVQYKGHTIGECRLDFVVADKVIVELKAIEAIGPVQKAQMICYLKITKLRLGIILNFNVALLKDGIKRIAN